MKSRVRLERFYNLKKESLRVRVFVVLGGRGIDYGWNGEEGLNFGGGRKNN